MPALRMPHPGKGIAFMVSEAAKPLIILVQKESALNFHDNFAHGFVFCFCKQALFPSTGSLW